MALTKVDKSVSSTPGIVDNSDATAITITSDEKVGIGTTSPTANLHVSGSSAQKIDITDTSGASTRISTANSNSFVGSTTNHPLLFITNDTEAVRLTTGGALSKTRTSVGTILGHNINWNGSNYSNINASYGSKFIQMASNAVYFRRTASGSGNQAASYDMTITDNGSVCINTTSPINSAHLTVKENDGFVVANTAGLYRQLYMTSAGNLKFWNGSNQGELSSAGAWNDASDVKIKKDIEDINYGLETVKNLKPRKYKMKVDELQQIGFIAQEIETIIPEVVSTDINRNGEEYKSLSYSHLTAVLAKAIQEQQEIIDDLKARIEVLEA